MKLDVVETVRELVRVPSVNPMGLGQTGPEYLEHRVTGYLQTLFENLGLRWERQTIEPQRDNIVACLPGESLESGGPIVMLEAHQDTVPVVGMTIEPWSGDLHQGRVHGRGSCDIKGGMAAMLTAVARLAAERPASRPTVLMACSVNEEHGFSGASEMAQRLATGQSTLVPRAPDAVVVAEPTLLDVVVTHKGVVRWQCRTTGRAAHSSRPELGRNAIYDMARVALALESYANGAVAELADAHPLLGKPTLSVGTIRGGLSVNTVPDDCLIEIDRRLLPEESPAEAYQHAVDFLARELPDCPLHHEPPYIEAGGLSDLHNGSLADRVSQASQRHGGAGTKIGVPFGTDARAFDALDIPTVVFGPGNIDQAHTADEWIAVEQLQRASDIYYDLIRNWQSSPVVE